ncbi:proline-rich protein PRCC [Anopheles marshallii]|uniref:proline-rich protein PRCC n=1 Tax=Anopheles marshallii TaxID=1521116 RepID=UPI00237AEB84|nr:proline-rich protein PRCC [Anopheles marshallii]
MSLVAYEYSSDEASDNEESEKENPTVVEHDGTRSVDTSSEQHLTDPDITESPKNHLHLPAPKCLNDLNVVEEDDEFLHKKAVPANIPLPQPPSALNMATKPKVRNGKVQITIPSMKDFGEDGDDVQNAKKQKPIIGAALPNKSTNLLSMLPKPRTALFDAKPTMGPSSSNSSSGPSTSTSFSKRLVPDSVANRPRNVPMSATKSNSRAQSADSSTKTDKAATPSSQADNSDEDDDGDEQMVDFFSFNKVDELPTVSTNEISAMVAKKAAKIAENVRKYTEADEQSEAAVSSTIENRNVAALAHQSDAAPEDLASETALSALIGGNRAKRGRIEEVDLIDITSADIVPSKEDFLRRQLQDETGYVPTGHLVGDWTCTSKRKSHITQLASKAQANAQELEAMWAANRQSRRQTQSKYGF